MSSSECPTAPVSNILLLCNSCLLSRIYVYPDSHRSNTPSPTSRETAPLPRFDRFRPLLSFSNRHHYSRLAQMDTWWFWPAGPPYPCSHNQQPDDPRLSCLGLPLSLPYEVETLGEMDERLEVIAAKLVECVKSREWGLGFRMWDSALSM